MAEDEDKLDEKMLEDETVELRVKVTEANVIVDVIVIVELTVLDNVASAEELEDDEGSELGLKLKLDKVLKVDNVLDVLLIAEEPRVEDGLDTVLLPDEIVRPLELEEEDKGLLRPIKLLKVLRFDVLEACILEEFGGETTIFDEVGTGVLEELVRLKDVDKLKLLNKL